MSLAACIPELLAQGKIRKADADKAERAYKRHYEALRGSMGDEAAAAEATTRALGELDYAAKLKKRQAGLQILRQQALDRDMDAAVAKGVKPHRTLTDVLRRVEIGRERIENGAHETMLDFIQRHRRNLIGRPSDRTGLIDVVKQLHGEDSGNATAKLFAQAIGDTFERLRLRFNRNGGDIGLRADFGLPHRHDPLKVRAAGLDQWRRAILDGIAPEKMVDPLTGGAFTPQRLDEFIEASWKNIKSNGLAETGGSGGLASRMLANRRSDPRFFVFKSGEAWLKYAADYGDGNPFEAIMSHVHGMARDIALMERLGPNPAASWRRGIDRADRIAEDSGTVHTGVINGTSGSKFHAERVWRYINGDLTVPVLPEGDGWAPWLGRKALGGLHGTRDVLTSALLGTAQITSIADINTNVFARKMNGIAKVHPVYDAVFGYLRQLNPLDGGHRREAVYLAAGARDATRTMAGLARWFGESHSPRWTQVLADDVLRVTGMNKFFEGGRNAFVQDYYAQLGRERGLGYDQLSAERHAFFERHGIAPEDWDAIRAAAPQRYRGVDYVDWHEIAKADPKAADKLVDGVLREARSAVLETDAESQSIARWGRPGTLPGEFSANVLQFKSFPLALIMDQARRMAEINARAGGGAKGAASAAKYAVSFVAGMTMLGAVSLQLKEILKGKDMRAMDTPDFWFDAFVNGGGVGVIGDLIGSVTHDRVSGLANYLGGPVVSFGDDLAHTVGSVFKTDPETGERGVHAGRQAVQFARRYTPGTTIWYLRAAIDRLLWDELEERADPDYADHRDRLEAAAERQGQEYWWRPGEGLPERAPRAGETPPP